FFFFSSRRRLTSSDRYWSSDVCSSDLRLAFPTLTAVVPPPGYRYVDPDAYRFARQGSRMPARIAGEPRTVLKEENDCRILTLPEIGRASCRERREASVVGVTCENVLSV